MLLWNEYIENLLSEPSVLDNMSLQYGDNDTKVSPIVKASIEMLESMISTEGPHNVFVLPEIKELLYEFVLSKIVYNVGAGKINITYDPSTFKQGQKLKYKNCVVAFDSFYLDDKGVERLRIRFADGATYSLPAAIAPIFQIAEADTKRFTKSVVFYEKFSAKKALEELQQSPANKNIIEALKDYKTHLDGSIFLVTNAKAAKEYFDQIQINGTPLKDVLLVGRARQDGTIENCYPGQLSGNPAIVLASDFYSVYGAVRNGAKVQSIIVNLSQGSLIDNQLDILDDLSQEAFPILCLTDTSNSFDLSLLSDRNYNVWRWDETSLVDAVFSSELKSAGKRIENCATQKVEYESVVCEPISQALQLLYLHKMEVEDQGTDVIATYNKLFSLLFVALRTAIPFEREETLRTRNILDECKNTLDAEKHFMSPDLHRDLSTVVDNFSAVFTSTFKNPKVCKITEILESRKYSSMCIVIADKLDKAKCEQYWRNYTIRRRIPTVVKVLYPQEYVSSDTVRYDATVIVGWLNSKNMRNVIYSYGTSDYIVLTYPCEDKWRRAHTRVWTKALSNNQNHKLVKNSFSKKTKNGISGERFAVSEPKYSEDVFDELSDIENLMQLNTYRQYGVTSDDINQVVDAFPVNFVGGYLAFYKTGHKVVTVTEIITSGKENAVAKTPDTLSIGDFVVVRESQRDIIKEIADKILENSGLSEIRSVALRWKEALSVETMFSTTDEIYHNLQLNGCERGYQTVKNWIEDEEQFSLSSKEDLICIAKTLNDAILTESIDDVFEAGNTVKRAHVKAGQYLSQKLRLQIAEKISEFGDIDAFNIWDPMVLNLEDIGKVIILKIIDINKPIKIDSSNTNRLLSE